MDDAGIDEPLCGDCADDCVHLDPLFDTPASCEEALLNIKTAFSVNLDEACMCTMCLDETAACLDEPLCDAVLVCGLETGCLGIGGSACMQPGTCQDEFDAAGGITSAPVAILIAWSDCGDAKCAL